jgi:DNA polymerase III epsilon subunit-like protein
MQKCLLLDLETQNFDVKTGIYEVAILVVENNQVTNQFLIEKPIAGYNGDTKYGFGRHNIAVDSEYVSKFKSVLLKHPYPILAHNCSFDRKFLLHYNWISEDYPCYCSLKTIKNAVPNLTSYSLENLVKHYKVNPRNIHNALDDVYLLHDVLKIVNPTKWIQEGLKLNNKSNNRFVKIKARSLGDIDLPYSKSEILNGKKICFTGDALHPRHTMQEIAILNGALVSDNITKTTTTLVVGSNHGSKLEKAKDKNLEILSVDKFLSMLSLETKEQPKRSVTKFDIKDTSLWTIIGLIIVIVSIFGVIEISVTKELNSLVFLIPFSVFGLSLLKWRFGKFYNKYVLPGLDKRK